MNHKFEYKLWDTERWEYIESRQEDCIHCVLEDGLVYTVKDGKIFRNEILIPRYKSPYKTNYGKELFEGDIIKFTRHDHCGEWVVSFSSDEWRFEKSDHTFFFDPSCYGTQYTEYVGDVYQS